MTTTNIYTLTATFAIDPVASKKFCIATECIAESLLREAGYAFEDGYCTELTSLSCDPRTNTLEIILDIEEDNLHYASTKLESIASFLSGLSTDLGMNRVLYQCTSKFAD